MAQKRALLFDEHQPTGQRVARDFEVIVELCEMRRERSVVVLRSVFAATLQQKQPTRAISWTKFEWEEPKQQTVRSKARANLAGNADKADDIALAVVAQRVVRAHSRRQIFDPAVVGEQAQRTLVSLQQIERCRRVVARESQIDAVSRARIKR